MTQNSQSKLATKHSGEANQPRRFPAFKVAQGTTDLYLFKADASAMFKILSINRRVEDKDEGYQRALSLSRVRSIANYINPDYS